MTRFCCLDYKLMPALEQSGILWEVTKVAKLVGSGPGGQVQGAKSGEGKPKGAKPRVLG